MNYKIILTLFLSLSFSRAVAQDHLRPNSNIFEDYEFQYKYYAQVRDLLFEGLSDRPVAQLVIIPSFSKELVWQINHNREENKYYAIKSTGNHSIWYNQYEDKPKKLKQWVLKNEITKESAELIQKLFLSATRKVRYADDKQGADGTTYYFSAAGLEFLSGTTSGTIWSPRKGSLMKDLVNISNNLISLTQEQSKLDEDLIKNINQLITELNNSH